MDGSRLGESGEPGVSQPNNHSTSVGIGIGATDQTLVDEPIDSSGHARAGAVGLGGQLAHAQLTAGVSQLRQDVEIAEGEPDLLHEIGGQLAQKGGVRAQKRLPGVEAMLVRECLGEDPLEEGRGVVLAGLLHVQSV